MKSAVTIEIYFLFMAFLINASEDKNNKNNIRKLDNFIITQNLEQDVVQPLVVNTMKLLHSIRAHILSTIFNQFLTIREILILRNNCVHFKILLLQNNYNIVMFCKDLCSKEIDDVPLIWSHVMAFFFTLGIKVMAQNMRSKE